MDLPTHSVLFTTAGAFRLLVEELETHVGVDDSVFPAAHVLVDRVVFAETVQL